MRRSVIVIIGAATLAGCTQAPQQAAVQPAPKPSEVGRYVIVHSPQVERDTVLLDTLTGRTWVETEITDLPGKPVVWEPMPQLNSRCRLGCA
jgi:hypothetical protein